jgi:IclR family acetate operon transcriptional repressor
MRTETAVPGTQTVLRAVALLKAFTDERPEWGLSDLARESGLNKTTAYRLLSALERAGMLARAHDGESYRLGPEAISLGGRALRSNTLRLASRAGLEALAQATGESVTLEVLAGFETLILDEIQGQHVVGTTQSVGTRWPANTTSTGKILLAFLSEADRARILPRRLPTPTPRSLGDREELLTELQRVRARGYALQVEELEDDFAAVGAPIFNHDGAAVAAVSVGGPSQRLPAARLRELAPVVVKAAAAISEGLGYRP